VNPPPLAELQRRLKAVFTDPRGVDAAVAAAFPESGGRAPGWLNESPPADVRTRLAVYSDAYFLRLLETLGEDYAALKRALGEESFRALAAAYLAASPSRHYNITDVGAGLPAFLEGHSAARTRPDLPDLARLESAVLESLLSDRLPAFDPSALAAEPADRWARARLTPDPTVRFLETRWAVDALWRDRALPPDGKAARPGRRRLLIHRADGWARVRHVPMTEWTVLRGLSAGKTLGEVCAALSAADAGRVQGWFAAWVKDGIVKGVSF
jgi:hypothetical protein